MIAPTNNNNTFSQKLMSLRSLIGMFILINICTAASDARPGLAEISEQITDKRAWTLSAQKFGYRVFGRSKDASLSAIRISYNEKGKQEFRLVSMLKGGDKRLYFAKDKHNPQTAVLDLTEEDFDRENNCVTLRMKACSRWTRVCDRRIFYLDQDGPEFIQFLIEQGKITFNGEQINPDDDLFKRQSRGQTEGVIGYAVTLMKDDWKNKMTTCLMSSWLTNWADLNKMMEQTSQLRVHMNEDNMTVKHFEISQKLGNLQFEIAEIISYDESQNRVLLKIQLSRAYKQARADRTESFGGCLKNVFTCNGPENRYLYLGANTDSKKFLLFLMEMYHADLTGGETEVFSRAAAASIPTVFQGLDAEGEQLVQEYIEERKTENAAKFETMCGLDLPDIPSSEFAASSQARVVRIRSNDSHGRRRLMRLVEAERRLMQ